MPTPSGRRHWPDQSGYFDSSCAEAVAVATIRTAPSARDPIHRFPCMTYVSSVLLNPAMKSRRRVRDLQLLSNRLRRLGSQGNSVLRKRIGGTSESGPEPHSQDPYPTSIAEERGTIVGWAGC